MNSIETEVYNKVKTALSTDFPTLKIDTVEDYSPKSFPCVQVYEADNSTDKESLDSSGTEKCSNVMFEASMWTEGNGRKTEAKSILLKIDSAMRSLGFTRISYAPLVMNKTIFRIVARYEAKVGINGSNFIIYRR